MCLLTVRPSAGTCSSLSRPILRTSTARKTPASGTSVRVPPPHLTSKSLSHARIVSDAYYTTEAHDRFQAIDDFPELRRLQVPPNQYVCARANVRKGARAANGSANAANNANIGRRSSSAEDAGGPGSLPPPPPPPSAPLSSYATYVAPPSASGRHALPRHHVERPSTPQLAPLEYLENMQPPIRDPLDDQLLRSFRYVTPL